VLVVWRTAWAKGDREQGAEDQGFVCKPLRTRQLERPWHRRGYNIKMGLKK
jgi:hypothetical protein